MESTHNWRLPEPDNVDISALCRESGLPPLAVRLLARRGLSNAEGIACYLDPSAARLNRPDTLPDIKPATERIIAAIARHEPVLVYGDYDVDGVTGTALLVTALRGLGALVSYYVPRRDTEGYGFSMTGVEHCRKNSVRLVVTNDCGSSDFAPVAAARDAGIDVIITDHHELARTVNDERQTANAERLPAAVAVVNPKRPDSQYPFRELAGVGVAFKLAWSLLSAMGRPKEELTGLFDLVGLGTIADVVPLRDENRVIARLGLGAIQRSTRPGVKALLDVCGIKNRPLTGYDVGFLLSPRINAAGRVDSAEHAVRLLLTEDKDEAATIARELDGLNRSRQAIEDRILTGALAAIEEDGLTEDRALVVAREGWHEGVIGIVAARLVERFYRPTVVIALKDGRGKGSGRSVSGFDLHAALRSCSENLLGYGGHRYAAGLTIEPQRVAAFRSALNACAAALPEEVFEPSLHVDAVTTLDEIDEPLLLALERFEPFGPDNPQPLFAALGLEVVGFPRRVGKDHLKLKVRSGSRALDAIAWRRSRELLNIEVGKPGHLDICFTVERRTYAGRTSLQLTLRDLRTGEGRG